MNILALDPSSTATGWAVLALQRGIDPVCCGVLRRPENWPAWLRVRSLDGAVGDLFDDLEASGVGFSRIVVEVPGTAQAGRARSKYSISGPYAAMVGAVLSRAWAVGVPVITVASDHWTREGKGFGVEKRKRNMVLQSVDDYDPDADRGGDAADAIMLGAWYLRRYANEGDDSCHLQLPPAKIGARRMHTADAVIAKIGGAITPVGANDPDDRAMIAPGSKTHG